MGKLKNNIQNLLDFVPVPVVEWERNPDGTIYLKPLKSRSKFIRSILGHMGKNPYFCIQLDDIGSFIWEKCDGSRSVIEIGQCLSATFGDRVEPVYERLGAFVKILAYQKYIIYEGVQDTLH